MNEYRKSKKILALAIIFFLSGLTFFYFRGNDTYRDTINTTGEVRLSASENSNLDGQIILKDMPPPDKFQTFSYKKGEKIEIQLMCKDRYATVLIYQEDVDYRYDPLGSKFNTAFVCDGGSNLEQSIDLESLNLEEKKEYYIVRAYQGDKNGWYDPY